MFSRWFGGGGGSSSTSSSSSSTSSPAPPKNKFSLENLKFLHQKLISRPLPSVDGRIDPKNRSQRLEAMSDAARRKRYAEIVEILREIAELMIWGDQHDRSFFDYFADQKIISHFVQLLHKVSHPRMDISGGDCIVFCVSLLQLPLFHPFGTFPTVNDDSSF